MRKKCFSGGGKKYRKRGRKPRNEFFCGPSISKNARKKRKASKRLLAFFSLLQSTRVQAKEKEKWQVILLYLPFQENYLITVALRMRMSSKGRSFSSRAAH